MSRELPILFNTEMVLAILAGQKTCTRRLPNKRVREEYFAYDDWANTVGGAGIKKLREKEFYEQYPPYQPGDILYVRETFVQAAAHTFWYKADDKLWMSKDFCWEPSIHMPKEAARIWLRVVDVQLERLQDITENGAKAEGAIDNRGFIHSPENEYNRIHTAREHFAEIWNSTIKKSDIDRYGWKANPWVWVIKFERCGKPEE